MVFSSKLPLFKKISDRVYVLIELIVIGRCILKKLQSMIDKWFVSTDALDGMFMRQVLRHLTNLGFKNKTLGNTETTFTMWLNFIFFNIYYLIYKSLKDRVDGLVKDDFFLTYVGIDSYEELLSDLDVLKISFKSRLEQYLKQQIQVRGYTFVENTDTLFFFL